MISGGEEIGGAGSYSICNWILRAVGSPILSTMLAAC